MSLKDKIKVLLLSEIVKTTPIKEKVFKIHKKTIKKEKIDSLIDIPDYFED